MKKKSMRRKSIISVVLIAALTFGTAFAFATTTTHSKYSGRDYTHNDAFDDALVVEGIDVSQFQKNIDWNKVKADGIDFAIIRVGGRGYAANGRLYFDDNYEQYMRGAKAAGLMVGVYYFSQATSESEAQAEAEHALSLMKGEQVDLPVFMDYEFTGGSAGRLQAAVNGGRLPKAAATAAVRKFCDTIKAKGYDTGVYGNLAFLMGYGRSSGAVIDGAALSKSYNVWVAQWSNWRCIYDSAYRFWQYDGGAVNGISGNTDCDFMYIDKTPKATTENSIANCDVEVSNIHYTAGTQHKPQVTVKKDGQPLQEGKDYKVFYLDNCEMGTAYAYVMGMGTYSDYALKPFEIYESMGITKDQGISSSVYTIDKYVTGVDLKTSAATFKSNITDAPEDEYTYKIFNTKGIEVSSGNVGTGYDLRVYKNGSELVGDAVIVVRGDSNGDGECNLTDLTRMGKQLLKIINLNGSMYMGLDTNKDGKVNLIDLTVLGKHLLGIKLIKG